MTEEDWEVIKEDIRYDYVKDNQFSELKDQEMLRERIALLRDTTEYVGQYYSALWVRKNILKQTDADIESINKQITAEAEVAAQNQDGEEPDDEGDF